MRARALVAGLAAGLLIVGGCGPNIINPVYYPLYWSNGDPAGKVAFENEARGDPLWDIVPHVLKPTDVEAADGYVTQLDYGDPNERRAGRVPEGFTLGPRGYGAFTSALFWAQINLVDKLDIAPENLNRILAGTSFYVKSSQRWRDDDGTCVGGLAYQDLSLLEVDCREMSLAHEIIHLIDLRPGHAGWKESGYEDASNAYVSDLTAERLFYLSNFIRVPLSCVEPIDSGGAASKNDWCQ